MCEEHDGDSAKERNPLSPSGIISFGIYLILLGIVLLALLILLWPARAVSADGQEIWATRVAISGTNVVVAEISMDVRLLLIAAVAGAFGSFVHTATSFATFVGNRQLEANWVWWYILRTPIGIAMALLFYFVTRAGLTSAGASGDSLSPYGIAAAAGLVGMFSKQAADKLKELADSMFRTAPDQGDAQRQGKLESKSPVPVIQSVQPVSIKTNATDRRVTLVGSGFVASSVVQVNGAKRQQSVPFTATQLVFDLTADDVKNNGALKITIVNPPPGGGTSAAVELKVET